MVKAKPIWECKIGTLGDVELPYGCDMPMRAAIREAFLRVTGVHAEFVFSGWSAKLSPSEEQFLKRSK